MSETNWKRIEKAIQRLGERQDEICDRIALLADGQIGLLAKQLYQ